MAQEMPTETRTITPEEVYAAIAGPCWAENDSAAAVHVYEAPEAPETTAPTTATALYRRVSHRPPEDVAWSATIAASGSVWDATPKAWSAVFCTYNPERGMHDVWDGGDMDTKEEAIEWLAALVAEQTAD